MSSSLAGDDVESADVRGLTVDADSSPTRRICSHCGKRFGCGKALGGHMRIHRSRKPGSATAAVVNNDISSGEEISCKICGKKFDSWRSVFGHMRAHPDREWRGMPLQPPPPPCAATDPVSSANSLSSTVSDNHNQTHDSATTTVGPNPAADLTKYLSFWSATGKRGRKGNRNAVPVSDAAVTSREPRSRLFKKKMRKLSDLETNHHQETGSKQKSGYVSINRRSKQLRRHGGSWNYPETESATTISSVTSSTKNDVIIYKNPDNKEILTACCREKLHHSAEHGSRKLLKIDLNELPIMEEEEEDDEGTELTH